MKKNVAVVGMGVGAGTLTLEALEVIRNAEILIGARRQLDAASGLYDASQKRVYPYYLADETACAIAAENAERYAVLVSGDVGFYSAAAAFGEALRMYELRFIPGVSSVNAFFAKLKIPWQDAAFASAHGRGADAAGCVRRNRLTFFLTGNNVKEIGAELKRARLGYVRVYVGENLGTEFERIYETSAENLVGAEFPSLTVLLFINEGFDDRTPTGLPDGKFSRLDGVPMTKSETRAVVMSKLDLTPSDICWDIGAGTGSVSVEMALSAYRGRVYAIERRGDAVPLIEKNFASFHIGNAAAVCGAAPAALDALPAPDAAFIGGSGGEIAEIIRSVWNKNPDARIVITAVTPETVSLALGAFKDSGADPEIVQINAARGRSAGGLHLMEAQNPVTILSAGGKARPLR